MRLVVLPPMDAPLGVGRVLLQVHQDWTDRLRTRVRVGVLLRAAPGP